MKKVLGSFVLMAFLWGCSPKKDDDGCRCRRKPCKMETGNYLDLAKEMIGSAYTYFLHGS